MLAVLSLIALLQVAPQVSRPRCDSSAAFRTDADAAFGDVMKQYAYLTKKSVDWPLAQRQLQEEVGAAQTKGQFVSALEGLLDDLYDPHATLKVNTHHSPRLVPSGLDLWAEWRGGEAVITAVRSGYSAEQSGLRPGMIVTEINGVGVRDAAEGRVGRAVRKPIPAAALAWGLLSALAGRHDTPRIFRIRDGNETRDVQLDRPGQRMVDEAAAAPPVEAEEIVADSLRHRTIGYIRLNALDDTASVPAFDSALARFRGTAGLILDLRNTPTGGSTNVAEPIMGRLIEKSAGYQRVVPRSGKAYTRRVAPRGPWQFRGPIVVLVDRWTGSMGEWMAIGRDGIHRAAVVGTRMAGLAGAIDDFTLPCTGVREALALPQIAVDH